jgi:hypothetical protein
VMKTFSHEPQKPQMGKTYKIISRSKLLRERFGDNLKIKIADKAQEIYGEDFMEQSGEAVCRFYVSRLDEISDSSGEVYFGKIGSEDCLVNESEIDFSKEGSEPETF